MKKGGGAVAGVGRPVSSMAAPGAKWADKVKAGVGGAGGAGGMPQVRSHAIAIDARRETNKLRAQMSGSRTGSPYGTPNFNQSPLVGDAKLLAALNLDPGAGSSKITDETRDQFEAFKKHQAAKGNKVGEKEKEKEKEGASKPAEKKTGLNPNAKAFSFNVGAKEFSPAPKGVPPPQPPPPPPPGDMPMGQFYNGPGHPYAPQYAVPMQGGPYGMHPAHGGYPGRGMDPMMYAPAGHLYAPVILTHSGPGRGGYGGPGGAHNQHHQTQQQQQRDGGGT
jgi:hypothetical protein